MGKKQKIEVSVAKSQGIPFVKNLLLLATISAFLFVAFRENAGYDWVMNSLIGENLKFANRSSHLSESQKMQSKFGIDAAALDYIKLNTPENAIILMPPSSILMADSASFQFKKDLGGIKVRNWALNLLYPRKLVYYEEKDKNKFFKQISHVVVMYSYPLP
ncbi:MAG: hypothetical protein ACKVOU_06030 [Cytophagales bacterium]